MSARRCRVCGAPTVDGVCEFAEDHGWNQLAAEELERETRTLWEER